MKIKDMFTIGLLIGMVPYYFKKLKKLINKDKNKIMHHPYKHLKVLFVLKKRDQSKNWGESPYQYGDKSSGLGNSVNFISHMLNEMGINNKVIQVQDGNFIDAAIHKYNKEGEGKVTHCIVEALWALPSKLLELKNLHKHIEFSVRLHSETIFISTEGIAMQYCLQYIKDGITVTANSNRMSEDLEMITGIKIPLTTNFYPLKRKHKHINHVGDVLNIANFGAVRVLKNNLIQAMAAISYCIQNGKKLRYFVNAERLEGPTADPVIKNLIHLFKHYESYGFELINIGWLEHKEFLKVMKDMNLLLQVSVSETYNICAGDAISQNVGVVGCKEIPFLPKEFHADYTDIKSIIKTIDVVLNSKHAGVEKNFEHLGRYNEYTRSNWKKFLNIC